MKPEELWNALKVHMTSPHVDERSWDVAGLEIVAKAMGQFSPRKLKRDEIEQASMAAQHLEIFVDQRRRLDMHRGFVKGSTWAMEMNVRERWAKLWPTDQEIFRRIGEGMTWPTVLEWIKKIVLGDAK